MKTYVEKGGLERVLKTIAKQKAGLAVNIREGLLKIAQLVYIRSQKYVPVDTGVLKASGKVVDNGKEGFGAEVAVIYEAPYAIYVHERTDISHAEPTQAKYVERAVRELRGTATSLLRRQFTVRGN